MTDWIEHDGKGCPVPPKTRVLTRRLDDDCNQIIEDKFTDCAAGWWHGDGSEINSNWRWPNGSLVPHRIIAYKVVE